MLGVKYLRPLSLITLVFFIFFIGTAELSFGQGQKDEDALLKARRLYQDGDYEGSIKLLVDFIEKLKAMVEQKKNVAEAFYLLAKIYFEVGDDTKADENLKKVYSTFPSFTKEESNFQFKDRAEKIRAEYLKQREAEAQKKAEDLAKDEKKIKPPPKEEKKPQVIEQPAKKKKKKKFPVLLVVGAVALVAVLVLALGGGKKSSEEPQPELFDIRGDWSITSRFINEDPINNNVHCEGGSRSNGIALIGNWQGTYNVTGNQVRLRFEDGDTVLVFRGRFTNRNHMEGDLLVNDYEVGTWDASRMVHPLKVNQVDQLIQIIKDKGNR
jgi:hypothetical protein